MELLNQMMIIFLGFWNVYWNFPKETFKPTYLFFLKGPVYLSELSLILDILSFKKLPVCSLDHCSTPLLEVIWFLPYYDAV